MKNSFANSIFICVRSYAIAVACGVCVFVYGCGVVRQRLRLHCKQVQWKWKWKWKAFGEQLHQMTEPERRLRWQFYHRRGVLGNPLVFF
jgi:hypothetical protein